MQVRNMTSSSGNPVANQFIIRDNNREIFQSYNSTIAIKCMGKVQLDLNCWNYSPTTGKYRNMFLGETIRQTRAKIDSGEYILTDLN